jgi:hypothetical protein
VRRLQQDRYQKWVERWRREMAEFSTEYERVGPFARGELADADRRSALVYLKLLANRLERELESLERIDATRPSPWVWKGRRRNVR